MPHKGWGLGRFRGFIQKLIFKIYNILYEMNIFKIVPWQSEELSYFDTKSWIWWDTGSFHLWA